MRTKLLISLGIFALLMSSGIYTSGSQIQVNPSLTVIVRDQYLVADGVVIKGVEVDEDNSSKFVIMLAKINSARDIKRISGSPSVTMNDTILSVQGPARMNETKSYKRVTTGLQRELVLPNYPVNESLRKVRADRNSELSNITISRVIDLEYNFDTLDAMNKTKRRDFPNRDFTAFVYHKGFAYGVLLNNTDGTPIGWVFAFRFELTVALFKTSTKQFVGAHTSVDKGHGNMMPDSVREYLKNRSIQNRIKHKIIGQNESIPAKLDRINWLSLGYNSTYDLDLYAGFYKFSRNALTFLVRVNTTGTALNAVDDSESFLSGLGAEESMPGFETDSVDSVESETLNAALSDESATLDDVFDEPTSTTTVPGSTSSEPVVESVSAQSPAPINYYLVLVSLFVIIPLVRVKKIKATTGIRR